MRLMIADITFEPYEATLPTAVHQHPFGPEGRRCWWVRLTTNCGLTGLGDIAPWPGFSPAAADIGNRLQEYGHLLVGQLISFGSLMSDFWSQFKELPAVVRSGLELAMLDVLAQAKHAPIAALLSPTHARTIQTHRLVNNARDAMEAVSAGFKVLKVKLSSAWVHDLERLGQIRAACPSTVIRLDVNGAWSYAVARERLRMLEDIGLDIIEQPVAADDLGGLQKLARDTPLRVSADESTVLSPQQVLSLEGLHEVVLKPAFLGGLITCYQLGQRILANKMAVCVTHALESDIGRLGALHLAAALNGDHAFVHGLSLSRTVATPALDIPAKPGLRRAG